MKREFEREVWIGETNETFIIKFSNEESSDFVKSTIDFQLFTINNALSPLYQGTKIIRLSPDKYKNAAIEIVNDYFEIRRKQREFNKINEQSINNLYEWNGDI